MSLSLELRDSGVSEKDTGVFTALTFSDERNRVITTVVLTTLIIFPMSLMKWYRHKIVKKNAVERSGMNVQRKGFI